MSKPEPRGPVSADLLEAYEVFRGLTRPQLEALAQVGETKEVAAGERIFTQRDPADGLFVVRTGLVNILLDAGVAGEVSVSTIGAGNAFGWSGVLDPHTYTATARAIERTNLSIFPAAPLRRLMEKDKDFAVAVLMAVGRMTASRLQDTRYQLIGMLNN
jgi:CRP/FNR family transcriptional regulator, cyclic AMP receptor protein